MNKIRKTLPSSPTKASGSFLAVSVPRPTTVTSSRSNSTPAPHAHTSIEHEMMPRTPVEQYWAARAVTAEALLKARTEHHREIRAMSFSEDMKRSRERSGLIKANEEKLARVEKLTWALFAIIAILALLIVWVSTRTTSQQKRQHWFFPSHFTIPIFSPFTSVVEHETSVIGFKIIVASVGILACLGYFVYRHWIVNHTSKL